MFFDANRPITIKLCALFMVPTGSMCRSAMLAAGLHLQQIGEWFASVTLLLPLCGIETLSRMNDSAAKTVRTVIVVAQLVKLYCTVERFSKMPGWGCHCLQCLEERKSYICSRRANCLKALQIYAASSMLAKRKCLRQAGGVPRTPGAGPRRGCGSGHPIILHPYSQYKLTPYTPCQRVGGTCCVCPCRGSRA
jgi:hypothetical protein